MQTMMQTGVVTARSSWSANPSSVCLCSDVPSIQFVPAPSLITLTTRGRSMQRLRADRSRTSSLGRLHRFTVRAEQSRGVDEGPGIAGKEAKLMVDDLKPSDHPGTASGLVNVQEEEDKNTQTVAENESQTFFKDVKVDAQEVGANVGGVAGSVENVVVDLGDKAEGLEEKVMEEAESLKKDKVEGETSSTSSESELTRAQAQQKFVDTAKDGYEVLKWAAEGVVSAGLNARQGLGVAKEVVDKRLKSFGIAADETKEVSAQVADVAQKKFGQFHGSASKFGEEFQVNLEEKKAADSLKPDSEVNPLAKIGQDIQENLTKAAAEDGLLGKLSGTLSESLSKVSQAGQELSSQSAQKGEEFASKASKSGEEIVDKAKQFASKFGGTEEDFIFKFGEESAASSQQQNGDAARELSNNYEDERGNELLKGQTVDSEDKTSLKFDVDETELVPSKKQDESDIGPDE